MSRCYMSLKVETFKVDDCLEDVKEQLRSMTDNDFNGYNGEDYFIEAEDGTLMSKLDKYWIDFNKDECSIKEKSVENLIWYMLDKNYSEQYYDSVEIELTKVAGNIVVSLAYTC